MEVRTIEENNTSSHHHVDALTLLSTTPIVAVGPPPPDEVVNVIFDGDIETIEPHATLTASSKKSSFRFYTPIGEKTSLTFAGETLWKVDDTLNFADDHEGKLGIFIDNKNDGKANIDYRFGAQEVTVIRKGKPKTVTYPKWRITGAGSYEPNTSILSIANEAFEICEVVPHTTGGRHGGVFLEFVEPPVWAGTLTFTVEIISS